MRKTVFGWLYRFTWWRWFCIEFVCRCPWAPASDWLAYHSGILFGLAEAMARDEHWDLAAGFRREVARLAAVYGARGG